MAQKFSSNWSISGYKGAVSNAVLTLISYHLGSFLLSINTSKTELNLPLPYLIIFTILLIFERKADLNVLSVEFSQINVSQNTRWLWFMKSWYFGILLLMSFIWRTFFRVVLLLFPLLTFVYKHYGYEYTTAPWILKIPYWLVLIWVAYRELRLIANVIEPPQHQVNIIAEWTSRALQLVLITFFMTNLSVMFKGQIDIRFGFSHALWSSMPFMLIVFTFFYVPIRWVEIVGDAIDASTKTQVVIFWVTSYMVMLSLLEPRLIPVFLTHF
ncbi:MAG TPA: hypothetical protein PJ990_19950 [Saprospiraceae bacterium]|nr:hypothetical protein [Saprospiraceae bacterium]